MVTRDVFNPNFNVQTGEVNVKGFELEARTELTQQLSVIAAYTYLDGRITKSNVAGEAGNRPTFTPEHQASIWGQYTLGGHLEGLTLGVGIRYVGATSTFTPAATDYDQLLYGHRSHGLGDARLSIVVFARLESFKSCSVGLGQSC